MGYKVTVRAIEAAERRHQREAQKRFRELERQAKEHDKLTAIARSHLEVETFENLLEVLLSVHKEQGHVWDWTGIIASLPGPSPQRHSYHEQKARQRAAIVPSQVRERSQGWLEQAQLQDEQEFQNATQVNAEEIAQLERLKSLAQRIRAGEHKAYTEALVELNPFAEMSELGSAIHFTVHTAKLAECVLKINGRQAILLVDDQARGLARELLAERILPPTAASDAIHAAVASLNQVKILLTWNCRHLANPHLLGRLRELMARRGLTLPEICTPIELTAQ